MKTAKKILIFGFAAVAVAASCALLLSYSQATDSVPPLVEQQPKPQSPFPLETVPRLTNEMSNRPEFESLDKTVELFMRQWNLHGASLAIMRNNKLIYAKGFGYADDEQKVRVQPYHIFRVASASKLITATAIMKLIEEGKLRLTDTIFGQHGILNDKAFQNVRDKRVLKITVKNLLDHSGGWTLRYGDPMLMNEQISKTLHVPLPVTSDDIIRYVLSKSMHFEVGSRSSYTNVGFMLLGRVVERVSGMEYEKYAQDSLLTPMGISNMHVGNSYPKDWYRDEVCYYEVSDSKPVMAYDNRNVQVMKCRGGHDIHMLGAAGGWVMSPVELLRFEQCIDGSPDVPDILQPQTVDKMVYSDSIFGPFGWRKVNARYRIRTGTLAGTSAVLVHDTTGVCWAFVTNTSTWQGPYFTHRVEEMMAQVLESELPKWNFDFDLFLPQKKK